MRARPFSITTPSEFELRPDYSAIASLRDKEDRRWRRARALGIIGTVVLHFVIALLSRTVTILPITDTGAAGPPAGDIRAGGGGGGGMAMIELRQVQPPAPEVVVEPVPEPVPEPEEVVVEPEQVVIATPPAEPDLLGAPAEAGASTPGEGGQGGAGSGPATGGGEGAGGGGEGEEGASRIIPPTPRGIFIPPPGRPASARGQEITVWVFVNENGRVDRNQIRLEPPTSDARYNQRLMQSVAEWVFDPATQAGRPVAVWYPFQIIL